MAGQERLPGTEGGVVLEDPDPPVDLLDVAMGPQAAPEPAPAAPLPITSDAPTLVAALMASVDEERRTVTLRVGTTSVEATLDGAMDTAVARTALARGERVIAQREGTTWLVLGALRTAATPGVDEGDEFTVRARRVRVLADHEISMVAGAASLVLRARGHVETVAQDITARAKSLHKIVGRMIRLN